MVVNAKTFESAHHEYVRHSAAWNLFVQGSVEPILEERAKLYAC
jgi:hypothetical protein